MGMYDTILCEYPLPGTPPAFIKAGHAFQTKDLDCSLSTYTLDAEGKFTVPSHTGLITFYTSNIVGSGPGVYTQEGEDAETVEYQAKIVDGRVVSLMETERSLGPALRLERLTYQTPTEAQAAAWKQREQERLLGRGVHVLWGGETTGYDAEVVYETDRELVLVHRGDQLEIINRRDRDRIFFDSEGEAQAHRQARSNSWDEGKKRYEHYVAEWKQRHEERG